MGNRPPCGQMPLGVEAAVGHADSVSGGQTPSHPDVGNRIAPDHDQSAPKGDGQPQPRDNSDHGHPNCGPQTGTVDRRPLAGPRQAPLQCSPPHSSCSPYAISAAGPACCPGMMLAGGLEANGGPRGPWALYASSTRELGRGAMAPRLRCRSDLEGLRRAQRSNRGFRRVEHPHSQNSTKRCGPPVGVQLDSLAVRKSSSSAVPHLSRLSTLRAGMGRCRCRAAPAVSTRRVLSLVWRIHR